jgi:hypothetical protein
MVETIAVPHPLLQHGRRVLSVGCPPMFSLRVQVERDRASVNVLSFCAKTLKATVALLHAQS